MFKFKYKKVINSLFLYFFATIFLFLALFPFFWMFSSSLKSLKEVFATPPTFIPKEVTLDSYIYMLTREFDKYILNSFFVSILVTFFGIIISCIAAYGFDRFNFFGKNILLFLFLLTQMFPSVLFIIPYFRAMVNLHLYNTHLSLIIAYTTFTIPFCTWMMKGFFSSIPKAIDESAMVDGCTRVQAFYKVVLPLVKPGLGATMIFAFLLSWNEYLFALVLISKDKLKTIPLGLASMVGEYIIEWNRLMAASVVCTLPAILLFLYLQKYLVQGLTAGAVKE